MFYEERFIDGVWYWRGTPDGEWTIKKLQMSKADEQKWRSPTGASIANHETDHIPDGGRMVSKTMNNLKQVRDALAKGKIIIGNEIVAGHKSYDDVYSYFCKAILIVDRMIETPAPTEKVDLDALKREALDYIINPDNLHKITEEDVNNIFSGARRMFDYLANTGRLG